MTLTKADLTAHVYRDHPQLTKAQSAEIVEAFISTAKAILVSGEDLLLSNFGKFNVKSKRPRKGRNPKTGDQMELRGRRVVTFKPSGLLRARVNGKNGEGSHPL